MHLKISSVRWRSFYLSPNVMTTCPLTHWGRVTHICVSKLIIIGSDNALSPGRRQAIIWINAGILLIEPLGTNLIETLIEILAFSFKKMCLKVSSAKWWPFCLDLNVLMSRHWDCAGRTGTRLSHTANTMAADGLETQGARASAAMVLTCSPRIFQHQH